MLDGRSVAVNYRPASLSDWEPITLEYSYPLGTAPPFGFTTGTVFFLDFDLLLTDDGLFVVELRGSNVSYSVTLPASTPAGMLWPRCF